MCGCFISLPAACCWRFLWCLLCSLPWTLYSRRQDWDARTNYLFGLCGKVVLHHELGVCGKGLGTTSSLLRFAECRLTLFYL